MSDLISTLTKRTLFSPLPVESRAEVVATRLRSAVSLGVLEQGEQLPPEADLAAQLNVSAGTLREALRILRKEGVLRTTRGRGGGSYVQVERSVHSDSAWARLDEASALELHEWTDWRALVSGAAAAHAAARASEKDVDKLDTLAHELGSAATASLARRADARLHIELAAAAYSSQLSAEAVRLQIQYSPLLVLTYEDPRGRADVATRYVSVVRAIRDGSSQEARQCAEDVIHLVGTQLLSLKLARASACASRQETV
jgi:DNA-binding FadR family transcriptional regulator